MTLDLVLFSTILFSILPIAKESPSAGEADAKKQSLPRWAVVRFDKVKSISLASDGNLAATISHDGTIRVCELTTGRCVREFSKPQMPPDLPAVILAPNGNYFFSSGNDLALWDLKKGKQIRSWDARLLSAPLAYSPDSKIVAIAGWGNEIALFTVDKEERFKTFKDGADTSGGTILSLSWSPNQDSLLSTTSSGLSCLWELRGGMARKWSGRGASASAFSPNGHVLASMTGDDMKPSRFCLLETATGLERWSFALPRSTIAVAFSPDGRVIAINDESEYRLTPYGIGLRDVASGTSLACWTGHDAPIGFLAFSADGRFLVSQSWMDDALVWDIKPRLQRKATTTQSVEKQYLESCWHALGGDKGADVHKAIWTLVQVPEAAVPFLKDRIAERPTIITPELSALLAGLASADFKRRAQAYEVFKKCGIQAEPFLRISLEANSTLETKRRIEQLLADIDASVPPLAAEQIKLLRTLEVLELIGNPAAQDVIADLRGREPHPDVRRIANAALERLDNRSKSVPVRDGK